jgi:hypothetical protein
MFWTPHMHVGELDEDGSQPQDDQMMFIGHCYCPFSSIHDRPHQIIITLFLSPNTIFPLSSASQKYHQT